MPSLSITRNGITVSFDVPVFADGESRSAAISDALENLSAALIAAKELDVALGARGYLPREGSRRGADQQDTETFQVSAIRITNEKGERRYKIMGGRYTQHGVTLYTDSCDYVGDDPAKFWRWLGEAEYGDHPMKLKIRATAQLKADKAVKVIAIERG